MGRSLLEGPSGKGALGLLETLVLGIVFVAFAGGPRSPRTAEPSPAGRRLTVPDSPVVRARWIVLVAAGAVLPLGLLAASCSDDGPGDTARFCSEVEANTAALTARPETLDDVGGFVDLYRDIADTAPLAIEEDWQALVTAYETASTVDVTDPESVERARAQIYATERSAVAVHDFLLARCNIDIGPVATVVGAAPAPPPTTQPG